MTFASELIKARTQQGLTQSQLAEKTGLSVSSIKAYEVGRNLPGARELRELCRVLMISPNRMLFGTELPFDNRIVADAIVEGGPAELQAARFETAYTLSLLTADEQASIGLLVQALAAARHGQEKLSEVSRNGRELAGMLRYVALSTRGEPLPNDTPFSSYQFAHALDDFIEEHERRKKPE